MAAESRWPRDRSLRSPGQRFTPAQLTRTGKNAPSALPFATRAGSPTQRRHHAAGAFYLIEPRPLTLACANRCPGSRRSGITRRRITRCPPGPCRCWAAAPVWSGPRAAEPRFVTYHRSSPKQENRRGDSRGEFGLCDPRRSHATTGASVRLASVAHAKTSTAPVARTTRSGVSRASGAGRRGPASERVRGLGTKSPRSRTSRDGFPARGSRARTASAGAARAWQRRTVRPLTDP